jgi:hypothetical protein
MLRDAFIAVIAKDEYQITIKITDRVSSKFGELVS